MSHPPTVRKDLRFWRPASVKLPSLMTSTSKSWPVEPGLVTNSFLFWLHFTIKDQWKIVFSTNSRVRVKAVAWRDKRDHFFPDDLSLISPPGKWTSFYHNKKHTEKKIDFVARPGLKLASSLGPIFPTYAKRPPCMPWQPEGDVDQSLDMSTRRTAFVSKCRTSISAWSGCVHHWPRKWFRTTANSNDSTPSEIVNKMSSVAQHQSLPVKHCEIETCAFWLKTSTKRYWPKNMNLYNWYYNK